MPVTEAEKMKHTTLQHGSEGDSRKCYTSPFAQMSAPSRIRLLPCCFAFILLALNSSAHAQDTSPNPYGKAAVEFVAEMMSRAGSPSLIALKVENRSSITPAEISQIHQALDAQFRAANIRIVKSDRALADVNVTVSENAQGLLWVAEIKQGVSIHVAMQQVQRPTPPVATHVPTLSIRQTPVFVQADGQPILDFTVTDAKMLIVLNPEQLTTYSPDVKKWRARDTLKIKHSRPWPRDIRGRLIVRQSQLQVLLPGVRCAGTFDANNSVTSFDCTESDDPWPLTWDAASPISAFYASNKNNFTGVLSTSTSDQTLPPFYSASFIGDPSESWIFAGVDGRARFYSTLKQQPILLPALGSDLATVKSECGGRWQVLVTRPGDRTQPDAVQALEVSNRGADPVSAPFEFPGPVTALWPTPEHNTAIAVSRNLANGNYEASALTISCTQ
ncbi:MAG: hypothetical protein JWO13_1605 [Acidobacteriales bacterium]|nr:hypothetical protein [Terriglobales bacterium]